jgi:elongation factor 2
MMGKKTETVDTVPCGNTVALVGIDNYLAKSGTITTDPQSHPLVNMKHSVSPVVRVAVTPKDPSQLLKLVESLKKLSKSDPLVQCTVEPTGEHIIACAGELHLEICINDLKEFMNGAELIISDPVVTYQETVLAKSSETCLAKSPNGHNRLWCVAEPLDEGLVDALEKTSLTKEEAKVRARKLVNDFGWNLAEARSIWAFGPTDHDPNVLVDCSKGVQYMNESKDSVVTAFRWVGREGVLAEENLRGVRFSIMDALLHADAIHRGAGQIIPTAKRVFCASQLTAKPSLLEPVFLVEIQCPYTAVSGVYSTLSQRRGVINETIQKTTANCLIKAYLPVAESFGFTEHLREQTSGQAFPQCVFDHWQVINGDPMEPNSKAADLLLSIRKRKGLTVALPNLSKYLDKL